METGQHHNESASERCPCKHCRNPRRSQRCQLKWLDMHLRGTADDGLYVRRELMKLAKKLQYHVESDPASPDAVQRIVEEAEMGLQEESGSSATSTSQTPLTTCRLLQVMMEEHPEDLLSLTEDLLPHRHDLASRSYSKVEGKRSSRMRPQTPPTTRRTQQQKTSCKKRSRHQSGGPSSGLGQGVERGGAAAAGQDTSSSPPGAASLGTEGGVCTLGVWMSGHPNPGPHPQAQWQAGGGEGAEAQPGQGEGEGEGEGDGHSPAPVPATFPSLFHHLHWGRGFQQNAGHSYSEGSADEAEPEPLEAAPSSDRSHLPTSRPPSPAYSTLRLANGEFDDSHPYTALSPSSSRPTPSPSPSPAWLVHDTSTGHPAQPGPGVHTFVVSGTGPPSPPPAHPTCNPSPPGSPLAPDTNPGPGAWPRSQPLCPSPATLSYSPPPPTPSALEAGPGPGPALCPGPGPDPGPGPAPGPDPTSGLAPCACQDQVACLSAHVAHQDAQLAALRAELQQLQENTAAQVVALGKELQKQQREAGAAALAATMLAIQTQGELYRAGSGPQPGAPHRQSLTAMTRQPQRGVQQGSRGGQNTSPGPGTPSLAAQGSLNPPTLSTCRTLPQPHPGPGPA